MLLDRKKMWRIAGRLWYTKFSSSLKVTVHQVLMVAYSLLSTTSNTAIFSLPSSGGVSCSVCDAFYVPSSNSGDILFLLCLFVGLFVGWTTLTLVITFEPFEIEPLYLACRFLVTRASNSYKKV